jgi:uncharacterized protein (DUF362 family)
MIVVAYGEDIIKNTYDALAASDITAYLSESASIKPNLVVSRVAAEGATTHPEVVEGVICFLRDHGVRDIRIIESAWVGDSTRRAFRACGYEELSRKYNTPLIDLKNDSSTALAYGGYKMAICDEALNADFLINVPVLKAHCQTNLTCCMKNLKGCIPDSEKRRFHTLGIHKPVAALNALVKSGYCVVDGICGDLTFEEGGNPVAANRIIVGQNPLTVDSYCAELIGYHPDEIEYLSYGKKLGIGEYYSSETEVIEINAGSKPTHGVISSRAADRYRNLILEDAACSACYSSLIFALHRLGGKFRTPVGRGGDDATQTMCRDGKIHIGQGFRGKSGDGIGIGNCTRGFSKCVAGCPPKAIDIIAVIRL